MVGMQIGSATSENDMKFLQQVKIRTNIWPSNSISEYIFKGNKTISQKYICIPIFTVIVMIVKVWKQPKYSIEEYIEKYIYMYICPDIYVIYIVFMYEYGDNCMWIYKYLAIYLI